MARYIGETWSIPLESTGFCHNKNIDTISTSDIVHPSCNVYLNEGGIRKRPGTSIVDTNIMFAIGDPVLDGSGLDDLSSGTVYTNITAATTFTVQITTAAATDKFKWMRTGSSWTENVSITGAEQTLEYGFKITFAATTGHTLDDSWTIDIVGSEVMGLFDFTCGAVQKVMRATNDGQIWYDDEHTLDIYLVSAVTAAGGNSGTDDLTADTAFSGGAEWDYKVEIDGNGGIETSTLGVGGAGYNAGDTFTVDGGSTLATGTVATVAAGVVLTYSLTGSGAGYSVADGVATTKVTGAGAGLTVNITALHDMFKWSVDNGANWKSPVMNTITGEHQSLEDKISIDFGSITGHDVGDKWTFTTDLVTWASDKLTQFSQWGNDLYICNGYNIPVQWNGSDAFVVNFSYMPSDWSNVTHSFPRYMIAHGKGNSVRNWAIGCTANPYTVYASPSGDYDDFCDANVLTFYITTNDGQGLVGQAVFGDKLFIFGNNKNFIMEDSDTNTDNWGWSESSWAGGVHHGELIVRIPNDIICMTETGEIYSVSTSENYGDFQSASLSRPSFIHDWIKKHVNLTQIDRFHGIYDPVIRAVIYFVVREGQTDIDTALIYFIDKDPAHAWSILNNISYVSGYSARCSALVETATAGKRIYTGGYAGELWRLGELNRNDEGKAYVANARLAITVFNNERQKKRYDRIKIVAVAEGSCDATIKWWIDGRLINEETINFATAGGVLGTFILGTDILGGKNILEISTDVGCIGKRIQVEISNAVANEDFFMSQIMIDHLQIGKAA